MQSSIAAWSVSMEWAAVSLAGAVAGQREAQEQGDDAAGGDASRILRESGRAGDGAAAV